LPRMSASAIAPVEALRVKLMGVAQRLGQ